jgi:hypothetical protein
MIERGYDPNFERERWVGKVAQFVSKLNAAFAAGEVGSDGHATLCNR